MKFALIFLSLILVSSTIKAVPIEQIFPVGDTGQIYLDEKTEDAMFYVIARAKNQNTDKLVFWMQGGPGCSSFMAYFGENGPYLYDLTKKSSDPNEMFVENNLSWNEHANIVYVDPFLGSGQSIQNSDERKNKYIGYMYENFVIFLKKFLEKYSEFKNTDFYISGESMQGQFTPRASFNLLEELKKNKFVNFKGVTLGNPWVSPPDHYYSFPYFAYRRGLINSFEYLKSVPGMLKCYQYSKYSKDFDTTIQSCYHETDVITEIPRNFDFYDITAKRAPDSKNNASSYNWLYISKFMNTPKVRQYFLEKLQFKNIPSKFVRCSKFVRTTMDPIYEIESSADFIDNMLDNGLQVILYYGQDDFVSNIDGSLNWIKRLRHFDEKKFEIVYDDDNEDEKMMDHRDWHFSMGNLTVYGIKDAGHMTPLRQPKKVRDIWESLVLQE